MEEIEVKTIDNEGQPVKAKVALNEWTDDPATGERVMYMRGAEVSLCSKHQFNRNHECTKCPFMFVGFRASKHIRTEDGIFERKPGNALGRRLA